MYPGREPADLWLQINTLCTDFFLYYESHRTQQTFENLTQYATWLGEPLKMGLLGNIRNIFDRIRGALPEGLSHIAWLRQDRPHSILVAFALLGARLDRISSADCMSILERTTGTDDWTGITRDFLILAHPKGELRNELGRDDR